ncbi:MAG: ribonuclease HII [Gammaproteobacteria bacterium]|nr:ribonuclease HII [Gammaproteobacteria bacterium]
MAGGWPDLRRERMLAGTVCGIDEAGVAPLAGPVVAAAVVLPSKERKPPALRGLTDSKLLDRRERERLHAAIREHCSVGVGIASVAEIDTLNVYHANLRAMQRAVADLGVAPDAVLVDGRAAPDLPCRVETVVKGDQRCVSIAAASVVAKVTRDAIMTGLAADYPGYGWETNVGYGTDEHYLGLLRLGPTEHHRHSFAPIETLFSGEHRRQLGLRFEPSDGPCRVANLRLLELRQDLIAIFDEDSRHVGVLKRLRGG